MTRIIGSVALVLMGAWFLAHLLVLGPVTAAADTTFAWLVGLVAASAIGGAVAVLAVGLTLGRTRPAWLRFVGAARSVAAAAGCGLVVVGLLHYRDTQPRGEVHWVVLGLAVLAGTALVHWWVVRAKRQIS